VEINGVLLISSIFLVVLLISEENDFDENDWLISP
jgi:hypothetical protein